MDNFLKFLKEAKNSLENLDKYDNIHLVMGNESCDLDSTVSTLALGYFLNTMKKENLLVLPIMNVSSVYFPLRTETCYLLKQSGIDWNEYLILKDEINLKYIVENKKTKTSIVDHHVLSENDKILEKTVVQIFDHRPFVPGSWDSNDVNLVIKPVGSCTTLITDEIFNTNKAILFKELSYLLYATIIFDTIGLKIDFGRTSHQDIQVAMKLEILLELDEPGRGILFDKLWAIHNDTSSITTKQLLYRDLKIVQSIPIPALPMLVETFLKRDDLLQSIESFAEEFNSSLVVLVGIDAGVEVKRDLALFYKDSSFKDVILDAFRNSKTTKGDDLVLEQVQIDCDNVVCFKQNNIKLTRKFIIPIVDEAVINYNKAIK